MFKNRCRPVAAGMLLCAISVPTVADELKGHDSSQAHLLTGVPVHVLVLNDKIRTQMPYGYVSTANAALPIQTDIQNGTLAMPGMSVMQGAMAGAAGGAIAGALINAALLADAKAQVALADAELRRLACQISFNDELAAPLVRAITATSWGSSAQPQTHPLKSGQRVSDVLPSDGERYGVLASYSLTPDYSAVVTTAHLVAHSSRLPGASKHWKRDAAWTDELVVVSDRLLLPAKTQADIDASVASENQRYAELNVPALVKKANAGDRAAYNRAGQLMAEHNGRLKQARAPKWTPTSEAAGRARAWSANNCARLRQALATNATDLENMMGELYRGELLARAGTPERVPGGLTEQGERMVRIFPGGLIQLGPSGDSVTIGYRYTWYPAKDTE